MTDLADLDRRAALAMGLTLTHSEGNAVWDGLFNTRTFAPTTDANDGAEWMRWLLDHGVTAVVMDYDLRAATVSLNRSEPPWAHGHRQSCRARPHLRARGAGARGAGRTGRREVMSRLRGGRARVTTEWRDYKEGRTFIGALLHRSWLLRTEIRGSVVRMRWFGRWDANPAFNWADDHLVAMACIACAAVGFLAGWWLQ